LVPIPYLFAPILFLFDQQACFELNTDINDTRPNALGWWPEVLGDKRMD